MSSAKVKLRGTQKPLAQIKEACERFPMILRVYSEVPKTFVSKYERSSTKLTDAIEVLGGSPEQDAAVESAFAHMEILGLGVFKNRGRAYVPRFIWYVGNLVEMLSGEESSWRREVVPPEFHKDHPVNREGGLVARSIRSNLPITEEQLERIAKEIGVKRPGRNDLMLWANEILEEYLMLIG